MELINNRHSIVQVFLNQMIKKERNLKFHYCFHNNPQLVHMVSQNNLVHILTPYSFEISFIVILLFRLILPGDLLTFHTPLRKMFLES